MKISRCTIDVEYWHIFWESLHGRRLVGAHCSARQGAIQPISRRHCHTTLQTATSHHQIQTCQDHASRHLCSILFLYSRSAPNLSRQVLDRPLRGVGWQELMKSPTSPIIDFYPTHFRVDQEGKRNEWEGVVLVRPPLPPPPPLMRRRPPEPETDTCRCSGDTHGCGGEVTSPPGFASFLFIDPTVAAQDIIW